MGWLSRLFRREGKGVRMTSYDLLAEVLGGVLAKSGVHVTAATAIQCTAVLACARVIANGLAQVPFKLYRADGRSRLEASAHPLFSLVAHGPNEYQTSFEFRHMLGLHLSLTGNAFVWLNRVGDRIVEMLPYQPGSVTVTRNGWELTYDLSTKDGKRVRVPAADMWHLRWLSWDGVCGLDGVRQAREAIGLALATEEHGARLFKNGARMSGLLTTEINLTQEQRKELREAWQSAHGGNENAFKTAILGGGMKWFPLVSPNDQAQFLETRRHQVEEVCRAFGVLPIMVGHYDKASTYASAEQMFLQHGVHTLGPWYACIEQSGTQKLLTAEERAKGYYLRFNANGLMRGAARDRAEFYTRLYGVGALSPNDIRELEDMNPYEGGDEYRVPLNMVEPGSAPERTEGSDGKA